MIPININIAHPTMSKINNAFTGFGSGLFVIAAGYNRLALKKAESRLSIVFKFL